MTDTLFYAKVIVTKLVKEGYIAYFAGGWVRDFVMGHPSEDIDIATNAPPSEIMRIFSQTILVGLHFGVVIVMLEGHQFEVATFRKDLQYLDGRHPQGIEMSTPLEDALRRDFTINGMFYDPLENVIHDFVHGQEDIRHGVIRAIGNPHERFFEDRLRMLRAFRFASRFGFSIDPDTQDAIKENADKLFPAVAMERVLQEFNKMSGYPRFDQAIVDMHRLTLLDIIFPEIEKMHIKDLRQRVQHYSHFPIDCPTILYLMEILISLPFYQRLEIAKRMKFPNKDIKLVEYMEMLKDAILLEQATGHVDLHRWATLFARPEWELGMKVLSLQIAEETHEQFFQIYLKRFHQLEPHIQRMKAGKPLISSELLQQKGVVPGKRMGQLLKEAERLAVNENWNDVEALLNKLTTLPLWHEQ